jgi:hypothetical protein
MYKPMNPQKYNGPQPIKLKSKLELRFAIYCDKEPGVTEWSYESVMVPYDSPVDSMRHQYYPDFLVSVTPGNGNPSYKALIEVKPAEMIPSEATFKKANTRKNPVVRERMIQELYINGAKFQAAEKYCSDRGWKFILATEDTLLQRGMSTKLTKRR